MIMSQAIYLDYNATTPIDPEVAAEMKRIIDSVFGNPSSDYSFGRVAKQTVEEARAQVAALINARPDEIAFTSCATESNNLAIRGALKTHSGKHIITSVVEHPAVIEVCKHLETQGYEVTYLPVDKWGRVNPVDVDKAVRPDTALISIMHANNETGSVQPIEQIASIANKHGILMHTDAAQSAGKIDVDVTQLGVDLLTIAGHKIYAPKGVGALYIKKGVKIENIMYGAGQEKGLRPGTENVVHIAALGKACEVALRDFEQNTRNMRVTRDKLLHGLQTLFPDRITVNAGLQHCLPNTLSVAIFNIDAHALVSQIGAEVMISTGSACHAGSVNISPVLKAMKVEEKVAASTLRISTGKNTTLDEIEYVIHVFKDFMQCNPSVLSLRS
jgi:cysteine desulfurase